MDTSFPKMTIIHGTPSETDRKDVMFSNAPSLPDTVLANILSSGLETNLLDHPLRLNPRQQPSVQCQLSIFIKAAQINH